MNLRPLGANQTVVDLDGGLEVFFSYRTPVACRWTNGSGSLQYYKTSKHWSRTTSRHINNYIGKGFNLVIEKDQQYFDSLLSNVQYEEVNNNA